MHRSRSTARWASWLFAAALLLKAAMPFLASASAGLQGKPLVEVCTVYGVSLVPLGAAGGHAPDHVPDHAADHASDHASGHCALTALAAFASADPVDSAVLPEAAHAVVALAPPAPPIADACAAWVARLKHGPPDLT